MEEDRLIRDEDAEQEVVSEIVCIIDRSGSMASIIDDAIGGFNSFLKDQRAIPGKAYLTLVRFDNEYEVVYESKPILDMPDVTEETLRPRGTTAMWDAIGKTLEDTRDRMKLAMHDYKVIVVILTDGAENDSRSYDEEKVKGLIEEGKKQSWEFLFLGANIDAFAVSKSINLNAAQTVQYEHTSRGIVSAYNSMSNTVASFRDGSSNGSTKREDIN